MIYVRKANSGYWPSIIILFYPNGIDEDPEVQEVHGVHEILGGSFFLHHGSFSFSRLFHEIFHDGTTSDAQHYELKSKQTLFIS